MVVCPVVTIGNRCVIPAGSVVVKDIPDDSLAAGCPAIVKKRLNGKAGVGEQLNACRLWFVKKSRTFWRRMPMLGMLLL